MKKLLENIWELLGILEKYSELLGIIITRRRAND